MSNVGNCVGQCLQHVWGLSQSFHKNNTDYTAGVKADSNPPSAGDIVQVGDAKGAFATNNLTVGRNGSNIVGQAADLVANVANAVVTLIYSGDATVGWLVK